MKVNNIPQVYGEKYAKLGFKPRCNSENYSLKWNVASFLKYFTAPKSRHFVPCELALVKIVYHRSRDTNSQIQKIWIENSASIIY